MSKFITAMSQQQAEAIRESGSYSAGIVPGLRLSVTGNGGKSWTLRHYDKEAKKTREIGLGSFTQFTVDEARVKASIIKAKADPASSEKQAPGKYWTTKSVRALRELTGCGVVEARDLLDACRGNMRLAVARCDTRNIKPPPSAVHVEAPWAKNLARNSEAAGHLLTARIQELIEPHIRRAIWQAISEVIEHENEFIAVTNKEPQA